jgi:ubiquitin-conjugating enzyme E2 C
VLGAPTRSTRRHFPQIYAGMTFKMAIHFPANYPMSPPVIKFDSPCYHPNVDLASGAICLDILQVHFSAVRTHESES